MKIEYMKSVDEIQKLKAVVLYVLEKAPEGMDYIHLFKSMYFAQQEHLVRYGMPLFDDTFVVRKHGPVPSLTYKVIRCAEGRVTDETINLDEFISSIIIESRDGHQIVTLRDGVTYDEDELSQSNMKVLDASVERCLSVESFELSELSHQDSAYKRARKKSELTGEDTCIPLYDIAEAGGATKSMLKVIRERQIRKRELAWI